MEQATCTQSGIVYYYCAVCSQFLSRETYQRFRVEGGEVTFVSDKPEKNGTVRFTAQAPAGKTLRVTCYSPTAGDIPVTEENGVYRFTVPKTIPETETIVIRAES